MQADATIEDDLELDALIVPSSYDMGPLLRNDSLIAFIKKHGAAAYDCALRHEIRSEAEGRNDLATIWRMVKDAILEVRQSA